MNVNGQLPSLVRRGIIDRRRSLAVWSLSIGLMCAMVVAIYPSVQDALRVAMASYPSSIKEAFGIGELDTVEQYLHAEMLSLIVPLALGFFALRAIARDLAGAAEHSYLDVLLSAPLSRRVLVGASFAATALELIAILLGVTVITWLAGMLAGADLPLGNTLAGVLNVLPLALFFAGLATLITGLRVQSALVTGLTGGVLVGMYVVDLLGRLSPDIEWVRYGSVFRYYGSAVENGIDPVAFLGISAAAVILATIGSALFERRDIPG